MADCRIVDRAHEASASVCVSVIADQTEVLCLCVPFLFKANVGSARVLENDTDEAVRAETPHRSMPLSNLCVVRERQRPQSRFVHVLPIEADTKSLHDKVNMNEVDGAE